MLSFVGPVAGPARALPSTGVGIHTAADSGDALIDQARTRARYVEGRTRVVASFLTPKECEDPTRETKKAVKTAVEAADSAKDASSASRAAADAAKAALPAYTCLVGVLPQMISHRTQRPRRKAFADTVRPDQECAIGGVRPIHGGIRNESTGGVPDETSDRYSIPRHPHVAVG
ncbi:hypothetical protein GCM10023319_19230 [Nocardia iowensis]